MGTVLAIETTTRLCSVALGRDGRLLAQREEDNERNAHAELVNVFVQAVMDEAGCRFADIDAVAVGLGPGSYTGSRIGLSVAKGICFALDKPLIGLNTLSTLVSAAELSDAQVGRCWPMIDARRMEVFTQPHACNGEPVGALQPLVLDAAWVQGAGSCIVFGDGADKATDLWLGVPDVVHLKGVKPHARAMLPLAEARLARGEADDLAYSVPLYGKEANVTQPGKRRVV